LVRVQNQVSLGAGETVLGKSAFEDWIWNLAGVLAKHYHSDNGIFISDHYKTDCLDKQQTQSFSGVGAKHQNARAERTIQTISYWACTMMVHAALHWPNDGADDIRLWAFAISHAAWLYNRLPNKTLGWNSPIEVFTKTKSDHRELLQEHVWECPVFVLDAKLQDGHKIPKFNRRARMGQFLGFSNEHSTLVARVCNLSTNYVSPQFHVVFDDLFSSIYNDTKLSDTNIEAIFRDLFENCRDNYGEEIIAPEGASAEPPPAVDPVDPPPELGDEWLSEPERREKKARLEASRSVQHEKRKQQAQDFEKLNSEFDPPYPLPTSPGAAPVSDDDDSSVDSAGDPIPDLLSPEGAISDSESDDEDDDLLAPEGAKAPNPPTHSPTLPK